MTVSAFFSDLSQGGKLEEMTGRTALPGFIRESKQILQSAPVQRVLACCMFAVAPLRANLRAVLDSLSVPRGFSRIIIICSVPLEKNALLYVYLAKCQ